MTDHIFPDRDRGMILAAFVLGLIAALAVLGIVSGLRSPAGPRPVTTAQTAARTESFFIDLPAHGIAATHSGRLGLATGPAGIPPLNEPALQTSLALLMKVRDETNKVVGFASELEIFPDVIDMAPDMIWDTTWTVMIPGRGGVFLYQNEHTGEGAVIFRHVAETGQDWTGNLTLTTSAGPRSDGQGVIVGGWGAYAGASGTFEEIDTLTRLTADGHLIGTVELRLYFDD